MKPSLHLLFIFLITCLPSMAQTEDWLTFYEKSGMTETPRYDKTIEFCMKLDSASRLVTYSTFGKSAEGRDLPLLIIDQEGLTDPAAIRAHGRIILLIEGCIHAGECEGKDAGLMLFRNLAIASHNAKSNSDITRLLDHVSILFIPIFNVDGHERFGPYNRINQNGPREMGWRTTSNNLNLNRDFLKADAPEMQAWLNLFNRWMPDFFIDSHTTDGADYQYILTYLMEIYGDMDEGLTGWSRDIFLEQMKNHMNAGGYPVFPYVDFRNWHDPRSGLITEVAPPMLSQGYTALRNRPGLLLETHMLKPYRQRVEATYECFLTTLEILNREYKSLQSLIHSADQFVSSEKFINTPFTLQFETVLTDSVMTDFLGVKYESVHSDLSGGTWFQYSKTPVTYKLPYFFKTRPITTIRLPEAYIIPKQWKIVIERLQNHGIQFFELKDSVTLPISTYRLKNPKWQSNSYEGRHVMTNIEYDEITENRYFPAGSVIVPVKQPAGRIIPHILEPKGDGSYLYWGFFDATLEQKEYGESYVLEKKAREMMDGDPSLKLEYEQKIKSDTLFAKNPQLILNWFYNKTPYADKRKGIYPVGKIFDKKIIDALMH